MSDVSIYRVYSIHYFITGPVQTNELYFNIYFQFWGGSSITIDYCSIVDWYITFFYRSIMMYLWVILLYYYYMMLHF
jgi:hypothetical protein